MSEEKIIEEGELDDLLEETKGENVVTEVVTEVKTEKEEEKEGEIELEIEPETQKKVEVESEKEGEAVELEVKTEVKTEQNKPVEPERRNFAEVIHPELQVPHKEVQAIQSVIPQTGLVAPVCSVEESVRIFKEFEQAKSRVLSGNDVLWIGADGRPTVDGQGSPHIKRNGWRKLARFFGLSWDIEDIEKLTMEHGGYMYKVRVKVWHPAGASVISEGVASSKDAFFTKGGHKEADEENVLMKAQTVAVNRAISDILGSGEVSGEERE